MVAMEKLFSVKRQLGKMKESRYSLMVGLQPTQKRLERVNSELKEKHVLTESIQKAVKATRRDEDGRSGAREK